MLLHVEHALATQALNSRPAQPWLWLSPSAAAADVPTPPGRGLRLWPAGGDYAGDVRCGLPLPLPAESIQAIVVQHAVHDDAGGFLDECARVLMPGGRMWLFTLNPLSPYRLRWSRRGPATLRPDQWRVLIQKAGLYCPGPAQRFAGPTWRARDDAGAGGAPWRAVCMFEAEKRASAPVGPAPLPVRWARPVATI